MMDKAQSSKQTFKSSKRRRAAIASAIRETSKRLTNSSEQGDRITSPINDEQATLRTTENALKKKRCPTQVKMIPEYNYQKMDLEFNEYGQVVGLNSDKFASIVGVIVREHVPVVIKDWPSVDRKKKMELWAFIQEDILFCNGSELLSELQVGDGVDGASAEN